MCNFNNERGKWARRASFTHHSGHTHFLLPLVHHGCHLRVGIKGIVFEVFRPLKAPDHPVSLCLDKNDNIFPVCQNFLCAFYGGLRLGRFKDAFDHPFAVTGNFREDLGVLGRSILISEFADSRFVCFHNFVVEVNVFLRDFLTVELNVDHLRVDLHGALRHNALFDEPLTSSRTIFPLGRATGPVDDLHLFVFASLTVVEWGKTNRCAIHLGPVVEAANAIKDASRTKVSRLNWILERCCRCKNRHLGFFHHLGSTAATI